MEACRAAIVALFCGGAVLAAAPPPTMQMMMTPSAQRTALYQGYLAACQMLESGEHDAALPKLKGLEKSDPSNALSLYLRAYAQLMGGQSEQALASIGAGNARPYLVSYVDSKGALQNTRLPQMRLLRELARGLVSYAAGLPVQKRIQALRAVSALASKTLTGRPFVAIPTLVGAAMRKIVDAQLEPAYSEAGNVTAAARGPRQAEPPGAAQGLAAGGR
jgi:hypothetical protein